MEKADFFKSADFFKHKRKYMEMHVYRGGKYLIERNETLGR